MGPWCSLGQCVLVISMHVASTLAWQEHGATVLRVRPAELLHRDFDMVLSRVASHDIHAVWVDILEARLFAGGQERAKLVWRKLRILIEAAVRARVPICIAGCRHKAWAHPDVVSLREDRTLLESKHRWCHFGVRLSPDAVAPSGVTVTTLSLPQLPPHPCCCPSSCEHVFDLDKGHEAHRRKLRGPAEQRFLSCLIASLGLVSGEASPKTSITPDLSHHACGHDVHHAAGAAPPGHPGAEPPGALHDAPSVVYPTDARERQKKRDAAEASAAATPKAASRKHRPKPVEAHYDDCGHSLAGLPGIQQFSSLTFDSDNSSDSCDFDVHDPCFDEHEFVRCFLLWGPRGSEITTWPGPNPSTILAADFAEAFAILDRTPRHWGVDVVEFCGGEGLTTYICIRRWLTTGHNFELLTGCDLNSSQQQHCVWSYLDIARPLVAVMAPTCAPFGPLGRANRVINPSAWKLSYDWAAPHGRFCGHVALRQARNERFYLNEQPLGSSLYQEEPWPKVLSRSDALACTFDQCMTGQRASTGLLVKKPTELRSNHPVLLQPFQDLRCSGDHEHTTLLNGRAAATQAWSWDFCSRVASGIVSLKRLFEHRSSAAYPVAASGPGDPAPPEPTGDDVPWWHACPACHRRIQRLDPSHTRVRGECRYPDDTPVDFACEGCRNRRPRSHASHTMVPGECLHAATRARRWAPRVRATRHPRDPRLPEVDEPTAGLPGSSPAGELGADDERQAADLEDAVRRSLGDDEVGDEAPRGGPSSSSASGGAQPLPPPPPPPPAEDVVGRERSAAARAFTRTTG